jgi:hypothetical protein
MSSPRQPAATPIPGHLIMNYMAVSPLAVLLADYAAYGIGGKQQEQSALLTPGPGHQ